VLLPKGMHLPVALSSICGCVCEGFRATGKADKVLGKTSTTAGSLENEALTALETIRVWQFPS
jgi:hypothetical protein